MIDGSGSVPLTNVSESGSGRPKNIWILRIRLHSTAEILLIVDILDSREIPTDNYFVIFAGLC
jgi:hypothetical protein